MEIKSKEIKLEVGAEVLVHYWDNVERSKIYTMMGSIKSITSTGIVLNMQEHELVLYSEGFATKFREEGFPIAWFEIDRIHQ